MVGEWDGEGGGGMGGGHAIRLQALISMRQTWPRRENITQHVLVGTELSNTGDVVKIKPRIPPQRPEDQPELLGVGGLVDRCLPRREHPLGLVALNEGAPRESG